MMPVLLIDSNFFAHQARIAMPDLCCSNGEVQTGILLGFLMRIVGLAEELESNQLVFCWDSKQSERKKIFPAYKEKRHKQETEEERIIRIKAMKQFPVVRKIISGLGFPTYCKKGYEGDDLFGSIVQNNRDRQFIIVTADEDMLQLLRYEGVTIYSPCKKKMITASSFKKKYGIEPQEWARVKALGGCKSDGVPGIQGVGEGKAIKYIKGELNPKTQTYKKIEETDTSLFFRLVVLPFEGTPVIKLQHSFSPDFEAWKSMCEKYELQSLLNDSFRWQKLFEGRFGAGKRKRIGVKRKGLLDL